MVCGLWIAGEDQMEPFELQSKIDSLIPGNEVSTIQIYVVDPPNLKQFLDQHPELNFEILIARAAHFEYAELIVSKHSIKKYVLPHAGILGKYMAGLRRFYERGISIHNTHHNSVATAEVAIALLLAASKNMTFFDSRLRVGDWTPKHKRRSLVLRNKLALIVGYGSIGKEVAKFCRGLGMKVVGLKRNVPETKEDEVEVESISKLHEFLPLTSALFLTVPLTTDTSCLIGEEELNLLPEGQSVLVNVSRGEVVDEKALYESLKSSKLFSAGIDVWYSYPEDWNSPRGNSNPRMTYPSKSFPFHELNNLVMTPHMGGSFGNPEVDERRYQEVASLVIEYSKTGYMKNCINDLLA